MSWRAVHQSEHVIEAVLVFLAGDLLWVSLIVRRLQDVEAQTRGRQDCRPRPSSHIRSVALKNDLLKSSRKWWQVDLGVQSQWFCLLNNSTATHPPPPPPPRLPLLLLGTYGHLVIFFSNQRHMAFLAMKEQADTSNFILVCMCVCVHAGLTYKKLSRYDYTHTMAQKVVIKRPEVPWKNMTSAECLLVLVSTRLLALIWNFDTCFCLCHVLCKWTAFFRNHKVLSLPYTLPFTFTGNAYEKTSWRS